MHIFLIITAVLIGIAILLTAIYLTLLYPGKKRNGIMKPFEETYIAHRGFFDNEGIPENSIPAFRAAVENGYGIELDVQLTTDNKLIVFHDETLKRMCGVKKLPTDLSYEELCRYRLLDTDEQIPLLKDVLDIACGKVPLIIEIKGHGRYIKTSEELAKMLDQREGTYCIESFNPAVVRWFRKNRPGIARGILASNYLHARKKTLAQKILVTNLMFNFLIRPDFIAFNHEFKDSFSLKLCKRLHKTYMAAWTIRSGEELKKARDMFSVFIFERFVP